MLIAWHSRYLVRQTTFRSRNGILELTFYAEVLKAHRQHYLYTHYDMLAVPFPPPLEARFSQQVSVRYDFKAPFRLNL